MYLEIFLADFAVFHVFLGISRDFAEIPEFRGSATARNIRSPGPSQAPVTPVLLLLDMKSTDFIVGTFLDTTNTVRLGLYPNVFLATPSKLSDFPVYIFCENEIQTEW